MDQHYWWLFALCQPIGFAGISLVSQHYKLEGTSLAMMRAAFVVLALSPFLPFIALPTNNVFMMVTLTAACFAFIGDSIMMNSFSKFGAGVTSRLLPLSPLVGFIIWATVNPHIFSQLAETPLIATALIASVILCVYSIGLLSRCDISKAAFIYLLPVIAIYGLLDVMNKTAQDHSGFWNGIFWYTFLLSCGSLIIGITVNLKKKTFVQTITNKTALKAGFILSCFYLFAMAGRNISMVYTENPAYTSIIAGATPLLVVIYHKLFNIEDKANVKAGIIFAISVFTMIYLVTLIQ